MNTKIVVVVYEEVAGCSTCPFREDYKEQGLHGEFCIHPRQQKCFFDASGTGFPKGCPMTDPIEKVTFATA